MSGATPPPAPGWWRTLGDNSTYGHVRSFLLNTRYWWIEGAKTESLRRSLNNLFDKYDVETLAPGYGCILRGRKNVEREVKILDDVLRNLVKPKPRRPMCRSASGKTT